LEGWCVFSRAPRARASVHTYLHAQLINCAQLIKCAENNNEGQTQQHPHPAQIIPN
jgi:hypothetical protein